MKLKVSTAPHVHSKNSVERIMLDVIIALLPTAAVGVYLFGYMAGLHIIVGVASAVLAEYAWQKLNKKTVTISDFSAALTGFLVALNVPVNAPVWITFIGSVVAIIMVKQLFGGIGDNFLNPALTARAILLASWPTHMNAFTSPSMFGTVDAVSAATPLTANYVSGASDAASSATSVAVNYSYTDLLLGNIPGTIGEVCKIAILIGFVYLLIRGVITWHIPVIMVGAVALFTWVLGGNEGVFTGDPLYAVLSGGLLFGAVFMATDYTTNPMTRKGEVISAVGCGLIVALIREYGSYHEGVTYAILIMNIVTPLLDKYIAPKLYGRVKKNV